MITIYSEAYKVFKLMDDIEEFFFNCIDADIVNTDAGTSKNDNNKYIYIKITASVENPNFNNITVVITIEECAIKARVVCEESSFINDEQKNMLEDFIRNLIEE